MPVIAMASEFGTCGAEIATRVATRLCIELVDHDMLLKRVAQRGGSIRPLLRDDSPRSLETPAYHCETAAIGQQIASELRDLAQQGDVLIHSFIAPFVLAYLDHVPLILVCAARTRRLKQILADQNSTDAIAAARMLKQHASWRDSVLSAYFEITADDGRALAYDLVADVGWLSCAEWTEEIVELARDDEFAPTQLPLTKFGLQNAAIKRHESYPSLRENCRGEL